MDVAGAFITGIFPRSKTLIRASRMREKNLTAIQRDEKKKIIQLQVEAGLTHISEPKVNWDDMLRPYSKEVKGLELGPLKRLYETNTFYRTPIVRSKLEGGGNITVSHLALDLMPRGLPWKAELPDPYTFAALSDNKHYKNSTELLHDLAEIIRLEAKSLVKSGFSTIQFNGPSLPSLKGKPEEFMLVKDAYERICRGLRAETYVHLYFEDASQVLESLLELPVTGIGVDFTATRLENLRGIRFDKKLICGAMDAKNTKMETPEYLADFATKAVEVLEPKGVVLSSNCCLEFLPYVFAKRKVKVLGRALSLLKDS